MKKVSLPIFFAFFVVMGCQEPLQPSPDIALDNPEMAESYLPLHDVLRMTAKSISDELNANVESRKEVYSKVAARFDGDFNIRIDGLSAKLRRRIDDGVNRKETVTNRSSLLDVAIAQMPKLQIQMPFAKLWTDRKIEQSGGLVVAWYPIGLNEREIRSIEGFRADGSVVKITRETARQIPFVILNLNERTDNDGYLKGAGFSDKKLKFSLEKARSLNAIDPTTYPTTELASWREEPISSLANLRGLPILSPGMCYEECGGGGGGGGGGYNGPGLQVGEFKTGNIDYIEGWLESEAEIFIKVYQHYGGGYVAGIYIDLQDYDFTITSYHDYDLDGGYWLGWINQRPWSERQVLLTLNGVHYYNNEFRLQLWDMDSSPFWDDLISSGDFNKDTFSQWGQPWSIGSGPAQVKIYQY